MQNANVNVAKIADTYVALTEVPLPVRFDLDTLQTKGNLVYNDSLPQKGCWESAHPYYDAQKKQTINYLIKFGRMSYYVCYKIEDSSSERTVIAEIPVQNPSYMHSFAVTENYIIFTEFPFVVNPIDLLINKNKGFIQNFTWDAQRGTQFTVINRHSGNLVGQYKTKPFFAFHHANAFECQGLIYIDIVTYQDASILTGDNLLINKIRGHGVSEKHSQLERFSLSLDTGLIQSQVVCDTSLEFPVINNSYNGVSYTYLYATQFNTKRAGALYKINMITKEVAIWAEEGCVYGEPTFIAAPHAIEEDDGVVISLVVDEIQGRSYLLFLAGKSFKEIARAWTPHIIARTLHGKYFLRGER